jgi:hypothetical protein
VRGCIVAALILLAASPVAAKQVSCAKEWHGKAYVTGGVYDGPVSERADLTPDWDGKSTNDEGDASYSSIWTLSSIYDAGRTVHIGCSYQGGAATDTELPSRVERCVLKSGGRAPMVVECE